MPRILYVTTVGWLVVATMHVSAQQPGGAAPAGAAVDRRSRDAGANCRAPKILPGTRPNVFSAIQGNALTSTNGALPDATVRLRDARAGQIIETQMTDQAGLFAFPRSIRAATSWKSWVRISTRCLPRARF